MEKKGLTIGFYSPYYDSLSGGERYVLTLASHWSKKHTVSLFWDDPNIIDASESRFGLDLQAVRVTPNIFKNANIFTKLWASRTYDVIFFLSDGSIPMSMAKHNILHFQVPFASVLADSWKMSRFNAIVCNSRFTKRALDPQLSERAIVIYPPVHPIGVKKPMKKKNIILSVGRFTSHVQAKKQEVLIEAFVKGYSSGAFSGWELVLAGGLLDSDAAYMERLNALASGVPIRLLPNISNDDLTHLYQSATYYWHAAGFGETNPVNMEHFGITTVEAMSAAAVPLVYEAGGQVEIVSDGIHGVYWKSMDELIEKTSLLIHNATSTNALREQAVLRAKDFDPSHFIRAFDALIVGWQ